MVFRLVRDLGHLLRLASVLVSVAAVTAAVAAVAAVAADFAPAAPPPCCEHCQWNHILFRVWLELDRTTAFATGLLCLPVQSVHDHGSL